MAKSKRPRPAFMVRNMTKAEHGLSNLELFKNRNKVTFQTFRLRLTGLQEISQILGSIKPAPVIIANEDFQELQKKIYACNTFVARSAVIQFFVIFDLAVNDILNSYQAYRHIAAKEIEQYDEVDLGINKWISDLGKTKIFDSTYSKIKHFRTLRNQFAHYPNGTFVLTANRESFESFLASLVGIKLDKHNGLHVIIGGKPGFVRHYELESSHFIDELYGLGERFLIELENIFLTDSVKS